MYLHLDTGYALTSKVIATQMQDTSKAINFKVTEKKVSPKVRCNN